MRLNFARYIGGMRSYMPSPAFGGRYALDRTMQPRVQVSAVKLDIKSTEVQTLGAAS